MLMNLNIFCPSCSYASRPEHALGISCLDMNCITYTYLQLEWFHNYRMCGLNNTENTAVSFFEEGHWRQKIVRCHT